MSLNGSSVLLDSALELLKSDDNNRTRDKYEKPSSIPDVRGLNVKIDLPILKEEKEPSPLASRQEARGINNQLSQEAKGINNQLSRNTFGSNGNKTSSYDNLLPILNNGRSITKLQDSPMTKISARKQMITLQRHLSRKDRQ